MGLRKRIRNMRDVVHVVGWLMKKEKLPNILKIPYMNAAREMRAIMDRQQGVAASSELNAICVKWLFRGLNWHVLTRLRVLVGELDRRR